MLSTTGRTGWAAPLDALLDVQRELDRVFDGSAMSSWRPLATDVIETADEVRVVMEVPGMDASELDLTIEDNVLRVSGEKRAENTDEGAAWRLTERRYGRFERSFVLPRDVRSDSVEASYENGVLTVVLPKREEAKPRRVEIRRPASAREISEAATK